MSHTTTTTTNTNTTSATATSSNGVGVGTKQDDFSLSDEEMLLCDDDEEEVWSNSSEGHTKRISDKDAANDAAAGSTTHADIGNGRSRRLLSLEQSKVLYKILDKVCFFCNTLNTGCGVVGLGGGVWVGACGVPRRCEGCVGDCFGFLRHALWW